MIWIIAALVWLGLAVYLTPKVAQALHDDVGWGGVDPEPEDWVMGVMAGVFWPVWLPFYPIYLAGRWLREWQRIRNLPSDGRYTRHTTEPDSR